MEGQLSGQLSRQLSGQGVSRQVSGSISRQLSRQGSGQLEAVQPLTAATELGLQQEQQSQQQQGSDQLQEQLQFQAKELERLQGRRVELEELLKLSQAKLEEQIRAKQAELAEQMRFKDASIARLQGEVANLTTKNQKVMSEYMALQAEHGTQKIQLADFTRQKGEFRKMERQIATLCTEVRKLGGELPSNLRDLAEWVPSGGLDSRAGSLAAGEGSLDWGASSPLGGGTPKRGGSGNRRQSMTMQREKGDESRGDEVIKGSIM